MRFSFSTCLIVLGTMQTTWGLNNAELVSRGSGNNAAINVPRKFQSEPNPSKAAGDLVFDNYGTALTFKYSTTQPRDNNWIGVWKGDDAAAPNGDDYVAWGYAKGSPGEVVITPSDDMAAGQYKAYLFQYGRREPPIAGPVQFELESDLEGKPSEELVFDKHGTPLTFKYSTTQPRDNNWIGKARTHYTG